MSGFLCGVGFFKKREMHSAVICSGQAIMNPDLYAEWISPKLRVGLVFIPWRRVEVAMTDSKSKKENPAFYVFIQISIL